MARQKDELDRTLVALRQLMETIPEEGPALEGISNHRLSRARRELSEAIDRLQVFQIALDPVAVPDRILDPADPDFVGELIAKNLIDEPLYPLASIRRFYGSGVYALYYHGDFDVYGPIRASDTPIYVGKADPAHARAITAQDQGLRLSERLRKHIQSIEAARNLNLADFHCRYLVVTSAWQGTAETYLIERFSPIWNKQVNICPGFGKHGDDPATRQNKRSRWDTLHPGRDWATRDGNLPSDLSVSELKHLIAEHFRDHPPR